MFFIPSFIPSFIRRPFVRRPERRQEDGAPVTVGSGGGGGGGFGHTSVVGVAYGGGGGGGGRVEWDRVEWNISREINRGDMLAFLPMYGMYTIEAQATARALLLRLLSPRQRRQFDRFLAFTVDAGRYGEFAILGRRILNVISVSTLKQFCVGFEPGLYVPVPDVMLSQKLWLENDPVHFFRVANARPGQDIEPIDRDVVSFLCACV